MDNTENGTPAPRRFAANQTQDHEERIQTLESLVRELHIQLFHLHNALNAMRGGY